MGTHDTRNSATVPMRIGTAADIQYVNVTNTLSAQKLDVGLSDNIDTRRATNGDLVTDRKQLCPLSTPASPVTALVTIGSN